MTIKVIAIYLGPTHCFTDLQGIGREIKNYRNSTTYYIALHHIYLSIYHLSIIYLLSIYLSIIYLLSIYLPMNERDSKREKDSRRELWASLILSPVMG